MRLRFVTFFLCARSCSAFLPSSSSSSSTHLQTDPYHIRNKISQRCNKVLDQRPLPLRKNNPFATFHISSRSSSARSSSDSALTAKLSATVASAAVTRGINAHYLVRILFLRGLGFVSFIAFLVAFQQNKALIGDRGITPAKDILDAVDIRAQEKRKRREKWWDELTITEQGQHIAPPPSIHSGNDMVAILKNTKFGQVIRNKVNTSKRCQDLREVLFDRSDRLGRLYPTLLWFMSKESRGKNMNKWLDAIALTGMILSSAVFLLGAANVPILVAMYVCQRSIMTVGGPWYGFGWEIQLAELIFHAMFMAPLLSLSPIPYQTPVPKVTIWAMRWYLFRIMMGAGLIKMKSDDPKWKLRRHPKKSSLSAMDYFYQTMPVPNPLTRYFHNLPKSWHRVEVLTNHFVELIAPWLLILPGINRKWRIRGGMLQLIFQGVLVSSGNFSYLNWLTMLPSLYCLDDAFVSQLFSPGYKTSASIAAYNYKYTHLYSHLHLHIPISVRQFTNIAFTILVATLSIPVVKNLCSKKQIMNGSFDPLRLINTYGAFGTVSETREELIIEASYDYNGPWREYEFKVKPGPLDRFPRFISPYHYRLDWMMWIAGLGGDINRHAWMYALLQKMLEGDGGVMKLLVCDPFQGERGRDGDGNSDGGGGPKYIRITKYEYTFADIESNSGDEQKINGTTNDVDAVTSVDENMNVNMNTNMKTNMNIMDRNRDRNRSMSMNNNMNMDEKTESGKYWKRKKVGRYFPKQGLCSLDVLDDIVKMQKEYGI